MKTPNSANQLHYPPELQKRAADFLQRQIPLELQPNYVSGSLTDIIIKLCSNNEPLDPELCEIARIIPSDYDELIEKAATTELKDYYVECQQLVREIIDPDH